jgi:4-amino-4-deoxy-L-arabinose transferase-like glycosyltransferase
MIDLLKKRFLLSSILFIGALTLVRMIYAQSFLLTPDETNYWQWARHPAWGYHDQTPMIAWTIGLFTYFIGHTELAVRLPSILSMAVASIYLVLIARHWFSDRTAWQTAVLSQSIFIFNAGAVLATADGLQGAAWAAASYHTARAFENHQRRHWAMGGMWFGFGMLSKYSMVLFLPCVFIFGLTTPLGRKRLASIRPYAGCLLGVAMFLPVIFWNAANHWNSFRHVAYLSGANEGFTLHWRYFGEYIGSQAGLITPMVFGLVCAGWVWVARRGRSLDNWIYLYLFFTSFPVILLFAFLSLHTRVYGNWPCNGYLTACVLAAALYSQSAGRPQHPDSHPASSRLWRWSVGSAYFLTVLVLVHVVRPILPIPPKMDRTVYEIQGWDLLGQKVAQIRKRMPRPENSFIFGLRYQVASELAFYVPGQPFTVSINRWNRPNVYDYWWQDQDLAGKDAVGVTRDKDSRDRLLEVFGRVDPAEPFNVYPQTANRTEKRTLEPVRTLYIFRCYDFKGGLRWNPTRPDDIRAFRLAGSVNG